MNAATSAESPPPFQFSLRSVLVLTTVCALLFGLSRWFSNALLPRIIFAGYTLLLAGYGFSCFFLWKRKWRRWKRARENRIAMERWISERLQADAKGNK